MPATPDFTVTLFLQAVAAHADPAYRVLLEGIANWYKRCGELSAKQIASVELSASLQGRTLPAALLNAVPEVPLEDMLGGALPVTGHVLADLCSEIASALTKAAERLR